MYMTQHEIKKDIAECLSIENSAGNAYFDPEWAWLRSEHDDELVNLPLSFYKWYVSKELWEGNLKHAFAQLQCSTGLMRCKIT